MADTVLLGMAKQPALLLARMANRHGLVAGGKGGLSREGMIEAMTKSAARAIGSLIGRQIVRGVLGSLLGGRR